MIRELPSGPFLPPESFLEEASGSSLGMEGAEGPTGPFCPGREGRPFQVGRGRDGLALGTQQAGHIGARKGESSRKRQEGNGGSGRPFAKASETQDP